MKKQTEPVKKIKNKIKTAPVRSEKNTIKPPSKKVAIKQAVGLEKSTTPINPIKPAAKKVPPVKRTVSTKNVVVDLKSASISKKKNEEIIRSRKNFVSDAISAKKRFDSQPLSQDDLIIRETENTVFRESTPRIKIIFLLITVIAFASIFSLVIKRKYAGSSPVGKSNTCDNNIVANGDVLSAASALMNLPQDESPTIATVVDGNRFSERRIFSKAENGDRILAYAQARIAILYRPSANKIIEIAQLKPSEEIRPANRLSPIIENAAASETVATSIQGKIEVAIYNGSKTKGLAASLANKLSGIKGISVVKKANAVGDFEKTFVIDLTGENVAAAKLIAQTLNGVVAELPVGETAPKADILVIGAEEIPLLTL